MSAPTTTTTTHPTDLDIDLLERSRARAAGHDDGNTFIADDLDDLATAGYLRAAVPEARGGWGLDLAELAGLQRRLARYSPAVALATCMHHYWIGAAADLDRAGLPGLGWILDDAVAGEVFASGHAESGNDIPILMSTTTAERSDGGYRLSGRKHFTSLSPAWTRLGAHAIDHDHPGGPVIIHTFIDRGADGVSTREVWDTLGMRSTSSDDTVLDDVFVPDDRVVAVLPAGDPTDPFAGACMVWALSLISNVYLGIVERAFELAVDSACTKTAVTLPRGTYASSPFVQHQVAEMYLDLHPARAVLDALARDWSDGVDHGPEWGSLVMSAKWNAVRAAQRVVSSAMDVVGGASFYRRHEIERLYRDVQAGSYHPPTDAYAHEMIGKGALGIGPDQPRW